MFYLQKIKLTNFRCYKQATFSFKEGRNLIIGNNAVGKTSLVEAIHCLCFGKSFRDVKDADLINFNSDFYAIKSLFTNQEDHNILLTYDKINKTIVNNEKKHKSFSEYLGFFNLVVFSPDDLELIKGSPNSRRRFLDINISQYDNTYLKSLIKFKRILKERNELLKQDFTNEEDIKLPLLYAITSAFINESKVIISKRAKFIDDLNEVLHQKVQELSMGQEIVRIVYKPKSYVENLWKTFEERKSFDIFNKTTTWGPTRDEFLVYLNDQEAANYCSQGQIRTITLAIKLALVELFEKYNEKIIIVLDDVFSELDINRQNQLVKMLDVNKQTFITTTSIDSLSNEVKNNSNIIEIVGGAANE